MYYRTTVASPNRTNQASPVMIRKTSHYQPVPTYFTSASIKTTPIKNQEQRFEPTEGCRTIQSQYTPDKTTKKETNCGDIEVQILRNELSQKDQEIINLQRSLELANEDRNRLRCALEQKAISCVSKEREIAQLLATIHQLEQKKNEGNVKELQNQVNQLKTYIHQLMQDNQRKNTQQANEEIIQCRNKMKVYEEENDNLLKELDQMQKYIRELVLQNKENQQKYQDKCLDIQKLQIQNDQIQLLQSQLQGKQEEIDILKQELQTNSKEISQQEQQNEIQYFLSQIKKQYFEDSARRQVESDCASFDQTEMRQDFVNLYDEQESQLKQPVYSFQTKTDE